MSKRAKKRRYVGVGVAAAVAAAAVAGAAADSSPNRATAAVRADAGRAATAGFAAAADTFVVRGRPHTNFGRRVTLQARAGSAVVYLRFKMNGLRGNVVRAMLQLYVSSGAGTAYAVRRTRSNGWAGRTITWANRPAVATTPAVVKRIRARGWTKVDVTQLLVGRGAVSLAVTSLSRTIHFASRESAPEQTGRGRTPKLFVTTSAASSPNKGVRNEGTPKFLKIADAAFDQYTANPSPAMRRWMRDQYWRMLTWSPYFDARTSWYPRAWMYKDAYAIYTNSRLARDRPEWILRDARGNRLYIPFACSGGTCPQYAGDFGNPAFRSHWIREAQRHRASGYLGLFMDDVNMDWRVGNGNGEFVPPVDPRTGSIMTVGDWRRYMAEFTEQVRQAFPSAEIVHNAIWYAGESARDADPHVERELNAANYINLERGATDSGIRGGTGSFGYQTFLAYIDRRHAAGVRVILESKTAEPAALEYNLASYFLITSGADLVASNGGGSPNDWWAGYRVDLGTALGRRYGWNGLLRRDFQRGIVLVNQPDQPPRTLQLPRSYVGLNGSTVTSVALGPGRGVVLRLP